MKRVLITVNGAACAGAILLLCAAGLSAYGQKFEQLALTPQMGWNSWNKFQGRVSEQLIRETADAMATNGMKDAGYQYVNIDDLWQATARDAQGNIVPDPERFPSGIKALADYVHAKGLKLGIYSDAGSKTCGGRPGSQDHETQDAQAYASWGVDYLKYDWCNTQGVQAPAAYKKMSEALRAAGRPILFSLCEWGNSKPWTWAKDVGQSWRTTGDIYASFDQVQNHPGYKDYGVLPILDMQEGLRQYAGPGHWNDPDMLEVGNGMADNEDRAHFTMWCMLAAPLISGNDLRNMNPQTLKILTDKDVIALNQDPLGIQALKHSAKDGLEVWFKPLAKDAWGVCFLNRNKDPQKIALDWKSEKVMDDVSNRDTRFDTTTYRIRDLWKKQDLGTTQAPLNAEVPGHDVLAVRLDKVTVPAAVLADQTVELKGDAGGKRFDGIGGVSGGGATSVLLKDYPEAQRGQILDLLFKPKFGASMSALFVEVPGDGNSTQGSELSHMHTKDDLNYSRGYEWWLMREAKKRNPNITLDGCAWSCPSWVGNGNFWSQDMCDYYAKWILGLKSVYGLDMDAIGCRNEKGVNLDWVKKFRATLNSNGLEKVRIHGFDNWQNNKFDFVRGMTDDVELRNAVDILSAHTMATSPTPADVRQIADLYNKPIWNSEEHVYKDGFDCEISIVQAFNNNYIVSGVTKIVNWYLVASVYPMEPYPETPASLMANSPWSGHYAPRLALWGYAHYGQFSEIGWQYLNGACGKLDAGGTFVTLKSPGQDYSVILETKGARTNQNVTFHISGGLSTGELCVWRSSATEQFVKQASLTPNNGSFAIALDPNCVYSISTTTGQQKGSFDNIPAEKSFPFPYYETFDEYAQPSQFGYLPHYTADIASAFEIADRPDKTGKCLRAVLDKKPQSWAPEWLAYTILGDRDWTDYEVSADIALDNGGSAGVMGRVSSVGTGYGCVARGYYLSLAADGTCSLFLAGQSGGRGAGAQPAEGTQLATGTAANFAASQWHNLKLQLSGPNLAGFVDGVRVLSATNSVSVKGMAGLISGSNPNARNTALFDNLLINGVGAPTPKPTVFLDSQTPMYRP